MKKTKKPECVIINGQWNWILKVDGKEITFDGYYAVEYFEEHYKKLGYKVTKLDEQIND